MFLVSASTKFLWPLSSVSIVLASPKASIGREIFLCWAAKMPEGNCGVLSVYWRQYLFRAETLLCPREYPSGLPARF